MVKINLKEKIVVPNNVKVEIEKNIFKVTGPKGSLERSFVFPRINVVKKDNEILFEAKGVTKREKTLLGTVKSHVKNMIKGVIEGFTYKLKICSGHFPMNVSLEGSTVIVKNFLGEKKPRKVDILPDVKVEIKGDEIIVTGIDKEKTGISAARIEQLTKIRNRDRRVFQDGIFMTEKAGKEIK
jgi:large subunit ribosomal protein L6